MKKTLLTMAAALALVSCSQDDLMTGIENRPTGAIGVKAFVPTVTRGTALNSDNDLVAAGNGFDLYAFLSDGTPFMGNGDTGDGVAFQGTATDGGNVWDYVNKAEMRFWSEANGSAIKFFAVSPMNEKTESLTLTKTITSESQTMSYEVPTNCDDQVDLMYALTEEYESGEESSDHIKNGIDLQFHHALSQILFKAKTESELVYADVQSVSINYVHQSGTFDFATCENYNDGDGSVFPWEYTDVAAYTFPASIQETTDINTDADDNTTAVTGRYTTAAETGKGVSLTEASEALLLLPQDLAKNAEDGYETFLEIKCKVYYQTTNPDGSTNKALIVKDETADGEYKTIQFPISTLWKPGSKYTYTLIFTADMGNPIKVNTVGVDEWDNVDENVGGSENGGNGGNNTLPAMELEPTGLYFKDGNILVGSADDLLAIAKYTGNRTVDGIGGGVYWLGEADDDGKQPMFDLQFEDNDESDSSIPAPSDWTENDVIDLIYYNMWNESSYLQITDIDLTGVAYTPIVVGSYDGGTYSVSNLTLTSEQALIDEYDSKYGCFVYARDAVKNLHMKNLKIGTSTSDFDYAGAFCDADVVADCSVDENSIIYGNQVAGICCYPGTIMDKIENCVNKATIIAGYSGVGICINSFNVTNCVNYGSVSGREAAGILQSVGVNRTISNCHNYGSITSQDLRAGGIVALADEGMIQYCHNEGSVQSENSSTYLTGAIVGYSHPIEDSYTNIILKGCYNVKQDLSLVGSIQYGHSYDDSQNGDALTISFTSCYNTAASANALVGLFYKDNQNDDIVRPFTLAITDCYYTNAAVAYSLENVDEGKATVPDSNTCIKLDKGEPESSNYDWGNSPMTNMNKNLSEYTYQDNEDSVHPLKLNGEPTAE